MRQPIDPPRAATVEITSRTVTVVAGRTFAVTLDPLRRVAHRASRPLQIWLPRSSRSGVISRRPRSRVPRDGRRHPRPGAYPEPHGHDERWVEARAGELYASYAGEREPPSCVERERRQVAHHERTVSSHTSGESPPVPVGCSGVDRVPIAALRIVSRKAGDRHEFAVRGNAEDEGGIALVGSGRDEVEDARDRPVSKDGYITNEIRRAAGRPDGMSSSRAMPSRPNALSRDPSLRNRASIGRG
jgi:hypothetical protein